jgi:hypothetical protein
VERVTRIELAWPAWKVAITAPARVQPSRPSALMTDPEVPALAVLNGPLMAQASAKSKKPLTSARDARDALTLANVWPHIAQQVGPVARRAGIDRPARPVAGLACPALRAAPDSRRQHVLLAAGHRCNSPGLTLSEVVRSASEAVRICWGVAQWAGPCSAVHGAFSFAGGPEIEHDVMRLQIEAPLHTPSLSYECQIITAIWNHPSGVDRTVADVIKRVRGLVVLISATSSQVRPWIRIPQLGCKLRH